MSEFSHIGVIGIGNVLMADDGFGPYVVKLLEAQYEFPENVSLLELGTAGADLALHLEGLNVVIVIDTINAIGNAGTVQKYDGKKLLTNPVFPISLHQPGLKEALLNMELLDSLPKNVTLVGVIPEQVETEVGLSPKIKEATTEVVELVLKELSLLGIECQKKIPPSRPDIWWETP